MCKQQQNKPVPMIAEIKLIHHFIDFNIRYYVDNMLIYCRCISYKISINV